MHVTRAVPVEGLSLCTSIKVQARPRRGFGATRCCKFLNINFIKCFSLPFVGKSCCEFPHAITLLVYYHQERSMSDLPDGQFLNTSMEDDIQGKSHLQHSWYLKRQ